VDDVRTIGVWLAREGGELLGRLREPGLWAALLAGLLLWSLAYQVAPGYTVLIGGDRQTHKRDYDRPFLLAGGFNAAEPDKGEWWREQPYRWTTDDATVLLPGIGGGRWLVRVLARSGRPGGATVESRWQIGGDAPIALSIDGHPRIYRIVGGASDGDVRLTMRTPPFAAPGDSRTLGLAIHRIAVAPLDAPGPRTPALQQLALLAIIQLVCYCLVRRLGLTRRWSLALALSVAIVSAYMLATQRLALTIWTRPLAALSAICFLLAVLLAPLLAAAAHAFGLRVTRGERGAALGATVGAFALRMAGLLHPYAIFSDLGFNVHNLDEVIRGDLFLFAGLPCEAGGGRAPYPPAQYLTLAPLRLLFGDEQQARRLIQGGNALLESCAAALIWLLLRRVGLGRRAALLGAILYVVAPPLLRSYSIGEFANIFGQSLLMPLLLFLALGAPHARRWPVALLGALLMLAILLGHTGMTLSAAALLLAWLPLWRFGHRPPVTPAWPLVAAGGAAVLAALALFYSFPGYVSLFEQRQTLAAEGTATAATAAPELAGAGCPPGYPLGEKLRANLASGFGPGGTLVPLLGFAGALGVFALWKRQEARLDLVLLASWLGMLLSFATLLQTDQAVRWQHALFPALCLGTAPLLARWMRRGQAGWALALITLGYLIWFGLAQWVEQIVNYLH
jgi:hypothetical protein